MKQKNFLKIAFFFLLISNFSYGQLVTTIDFETEDAGYTPSTTTGSDNTDAFNRTNTGVNGNSTYYWVAEDISGNPSIDLDQIDVSGSTSFTFAIDLSYDNAAQWDSTDELLITYSLDGGTDQNLMWVQHINNDSFNEPAALDLDFDGNGDVGQELSTSSFITFTTSSIALISNSTLDIKLQFNNLTSNGEGIFLDNIIITETAGSGNLAPVISSISNSPTTPTSSDAVTVSANITDSDDIASKNINWGTTSGNLTNTVAMSNTSGDTYEGTIPAQANGTTVFYEIEATDSNASPETTTSAEQSYTVTDPTPGITLGAVSGNTNESATTATFTVVLDAQPTTDVVVNISSGDTGEVTVNAPTTLTFTNANWDNPQTVTVTGVDDVASDGDIDVIITIAVDDALSDDAYDTLSETTTVTNVDNDLPSAAIPYSEDFSDCNTQEWTVATVGAELEWTCGSGYFEANAFGSSGVADDYLISPSFDMDAQTGETLNFNSWTQFEDTGDGVQNIELLYTTNYTGDPSTTTWVNTLSPTWPAANSQTSTGSGNVDISTITGTAVHFAFRYTSTGTGGGSTERWRIEDFDITTASTPNITLSETSLSDFDYELGSGPSAEQTFTAEGSSLTADITITAPTDFEVSTTSGSGFDSSIILTQDEGAVASTTIYVRLASDLAINTYTGDITASSTGAASKTISLSGEVTAASCAGTPTSFPFNGVSGSTNLDHDNSGSNPSGSSGESCGTNYRIFYEKTPSSDGSGNYIRSNASDDLIESADWGGEGKFETFAIDVSGETSIDIETFGATVNGGFNANSEQFQWWYKLDSGSEINLGAAFGDGTSYTGSLAIGPTTIDVTGVNAIIVGFTFNMNGGSDGFEDVNLIVTTTSTWDGSESNDWATAGNWSNGVPATTTDVTIPAGLTNYPTVTTAETVNSLTIASGATLVATNASFTVTNNATYSRNLASGSQWYLMSSPVNGENYNNDWVTANSIPSSSQDTDNRGISWYDNSSSDTDSDGAGTSDSATGYWRYMEANDDTSFAVGRGYGVIRSGSGDIEFIGSGIYTSNQNFAVTQGENNFNLIGNPFTGFITLGTFYTTNSTVIGDTFHTWNGSSYTARLNNIIDSENQNFEIAPGQGFFVEASSAGNVTFEISDVSHQGTDTFQKNSGNLSKINLFLSDGSNNRSAKLYYIEGTSVNYDPGYDGKLFGGVSHSFALYSHLVSNDQGEKYQVQSLPNSDHENMVVPIGLIADSGKEITFTAEALNLPSGLKVFLEDRLTNTFTRLDEANSAYTVALTEKSDGVGRFYVHTKASALNIDEVQMENISMYTSNASTLRIVGLPQGKASIKLFNILGKQVLQTSFTSNGAKDITLPNVSAGIYIVQLKTATGQLNQKITLD